MGPRAEGERSRTEMVLAQAFREKRLKSEYLVLPVRIVRRPPGRPPGASVRIEARERRIATAGEYRSRLGEAEELFGVDDGRKAAAYFPVLRQYPVVITEVIKSAMLG